MVNPEQLAAVLALGHETRSVEYKSAGDFDDTRLLYRVIRAILGMTNLRDGGLVLLGVDRSGAVQGLSEPQGQAWSNHDTLAGRVSRYAEPYVEFETAIVRPAGYSVDVVVINVKQFSDVPVLCKSTQLDPDNARKMLLRDGATYVRTHSPVATREIPSSGYMRELLDLALEQRLRRHLDTTHRAGGTITPSATATDPYEKQRAEFGRE